MGCGDEASPYVGCFADVLSLAEPQRAEAVARIGRPEELSTRAIAESLSTWTELQEQLATTIGAASSPKDAKSRIDSWARTIARSEPLAATLFRVSLQADLAGQLFVRTVELPELNPIRINDPRPVPPFLRLTFEEALRLFLDRKILTPAEFEALSDEHRAQAFTATRLASDALRSRAFELLSQAIANGDTLRDFASALRDGRAALGVTEEDPGYLETVFRTNIGSAYSQGRRSQITSDVVRSARPYIQYRATGDERTTSICRSLNGLIFSQDDPDWPRFSPLNHFNCRSVIVALAAPPAGTSVTRAADLTVRPDPGFDA